MALLGSIVAPKLGGTLRGVGHNTPQLLMDILPLVVEGSVAALLFAWKATGSSHMPREDLSPQK